VRGGGKGAGRRRKFCAALGLVQNKVVDEKILGGRVLGCHSDIVSAAQTVRRPSTLKLVKKSRFLAPKPAKYPRSHATKPKKSPGFDWLFVWHAREAPHMQTYGHCSKHRVQTRVSCEAPSGRHPCLYTSSWGLGALSVADIPSALAIIRRNAGTCF